MTEHQRASVNRPREVRVYCVATQVLCVSQACRRCPVASRSRCGEKLKGVIRVDRSEIRSLVNEVVRQSVEETLNGLLEAEAEQLCQAKRYERSANRADTRAGHYKRTLHTKAGEVELKMPRLRRIRLETEIIGRYQRRESSVEGALMDFRGHHGRAAENHRCHPVQLEIREVADRPALERSLGTVRFVSLVRARPPASHQRLGFRSSAFRVKSHVPARESDVCLR